MTNEIHHSFLIQILLSIYREPFLRKYLYFKGGTALYLFYDLPRFSTDLDFDISQKCSDLKTIFQKLEMVLKKYGTLRDSRIKKNTILFVLSYEKYSRLIKIEISMRESSEDIEIKNIFGVDIKILSLDTLCAHKFVALTERTKARDLFDAYFILLNNFPVNEKIIEVRTQKNLKLFWKYLQNQIIKNFNHKNILHELGEVIEPNQKNWIRDHLKRTVIEMLRKKV